MRTSRGRSIVRVSTFVLAGALAGVLSGCAGEGTAGATAPPTAASPSASVTPSETPTLAPVVVVTGLVLTPEAMQLTSSEGSVVTFSYYDPIEGVVGALTAAFGADPVVGRETPTVEPGPQTLYDWPGLRIVDEDWPAVAPLDSNFYVVLTAPTLNDVTLATVDGIRIGDPALPLAEQNPNSGTAGDGFAVFVGRIDIPRSETNQRDGSSLSVSVWTDNSERTITSISAPSEDYGA